MNHTQKRWGRAGNCWPISLLLVWMWPLACITVGAADDPKSEGETRLSQAAIEKAVRELSDQDKKVRRAAVALLEKHLWNWGTLGKQFSKGLWKPLVDVLGDDEAETRHRALDILLYLARWPGIDPKDGPNIVPAVLPLLKDSDAKVRVRTALLLWDVDASRRGEAVAVLRQALQDDNEDVKLEAAIGLTLRDPTRPEPVPFFTAKVKKGDAGNAAAAAYYLGELGPRAKAAVPALIENLKNNELDVRVSAAEALARIDADQREKLIPVLRELLQDETWGMQAAQALAVIGPPAKAVLPQLRAALKEVKETTSLQEKLRQVAFRFAVVQIDPAQTDVVPSLVRMLKNADVLVRANIVFTLGQIGPAAKAAVPALLEAAANAPADNQAFDLRYTACLALGRIGPDAKGAVPYLTSLLQADEYVIRREAAEALKKTQGSAPGVRLGR